MAATALDPVTLKILWDRLITIADEATTTQLRAAFTSAVRESNDFAVTIMDTGAGTLAAAQIGIPSFITSQSVALRQALIEFPLDSFEPGDVIITNDPWIASGQLMDLTVFAPIFKRGELVAFGGSVAHSPDLGGALRWSQSADVYEDGLFLPLMKLMRAGEPNADLMRLLRANCRAPGRTLGDLEAQLSALRILDARVVELMDEHGLDRLDALVEEIYSRSEAIMRSEIAKIPDGRYTGEVELDNTLPNPLTGVVDRMDEPFMVRVAITVDGSDMTIDYTGSSPQLRNSANAVGPMAYAYTVYAVRLMLVPFLPSNAGFFRPLEVICPDGTAVSARFPTPTLYRHVVGHQVCDAVFEALVTAIPDRVLAPGGSTPSWTLSMAGEDRSGHPISRLLMINGGMGAYPSKDGEIVGFPANPSCTPAEMIESEQPMVVEAKEVIPDSAGPGRHRGAPGQRMAFRAQQDGTVYSMITAKVENPPRGLLGGLPGRAGRLLLNGKVVSPHDGVLMAGDLLVVETPGGGGLHPPIERPIAKVAADVREGIVSIDQARLAYGVVIDPDTFVADVEASDRLRAAIGREGR